MAELSGSQALVDAVRRLRAAGVPNPAGDARRLLAHALGIPAARLTLVLPEVLPPEALARLSRAIAARATRQPVSQIIGRREFFGRAFDVTPDVLDPRPETEVLVLCALARPFSTVLDLGTGSGAILLSLLAERPKAVGLGTDVSDPALAVARRNAEALGLAARARFASGSWWDAVQGQFDLIVSNPPYIAQAEMAGLSADVREHEPHIALTDGANGLTAYRTIARGVWDHLNPGGTLAVEIGPTQAIAVSALFIKAGLRRIEVKRDLDDRPRVVLAQRPMENQSPGEQ